MNKQARRICFAPETKSSDRSLYLKAFTFPRNRIFIRLFIQKIFKIAYCPNVNLFFIVQMLSNSLL
jgi:hypothetical protein